MVETKSRSESVAILAKEKSRDILAELSDMDHISTHGASVQPVKGTCEWILRQRLFLEWRDAPKSSLLWITGGPGSGKSTLSDFIANQLEVDTKPSHSTAVCRYSFSNRGSAPEAFLRRMISQSLNTIHELCGLAIEHLGTKSSGSLRTWDSLWLFWTNVCEKVKGGKIFWIIDALDECTDTGKMKDFCCRVVALITTLNNTTASSLSCHILLTGRPGVCREIDPRPKSRITLEDEAAIDEDIKTLIDAKVQELAASESLREAEVNELKYRLHQGADRTFIWVALALEIFENDLRRKTYDQRSWAQSLSKITSSLSGTYAKLWSQLDYDSPSKTRDLLQLVLAGNGFFTVPELTILLTLNDQNKTIGDVEQEAVAHGQFVQKSHGSFLRIVTRPDGLQQMRLVHETAKEYLIQTMDCLITMEDCHLQLAKRCVKYLLLTGLDDILDQIGSQTAEPNHQEHPLLKYAILNWAFHLRSSNFELNDKQFAEEVLDLYRNNSKRYLGWSKAYWQLSSCTDSKTGCTPLQMCTYNGHVRILKSLLGSLDGEDLKAKVDQKDAAGDTSLHYAAEYGRADMIDALLALDADSNIRNKAGLTALHKAVECNEEKVVERLINGGVNIDVRTTGKDPRRTALHIAAGAGSLNMVKLLVDHGANIEIYNAVSLTAADQAFEEGHGQIQQYLLTRQSGSGITDLDRAIVEGDVDRVRSLLTCTESLYTTDNKGSTSLHSAARGSNEEIVRLVLKHLQDTEMQDDDGMTPLHVASRYGCREIVEILLEHGAKVGALSTDLSTPLHEAALGGNDAIVKRLLDAKAAPTAVDVQLQTPISHASSLGFDQVVETLLVNMKDKDIRDNIGLLPIHTAARYGHTNIVERLLRDNPKHIEAVDWSGYTPLSFAALGRSSSHAKTVKTLIEHGANVLHRARGGSTPILLAAESGGEEAMKYLLGENIINLPPRPVDPEERNARGLSPLSRAAAGGHEGAILILLKHGVKDVNTLEKTWRDPLSWAAGHGLVEAVRELLKVPGIVIDSRDEDHRTPLSHAAGNGHAAIVSQLLRYNELHKSRAEVDSLDTLGRTPLSWAAAAGHKDIVELLLDHEANPTIRSEKSGGAPISWAAFGGHNEVLSLFLDREADLLETIRDNSGGHVLSVAAVNGKTKTVEFLLKRSTAEINEADKEGFTPLMHAAHCCEEDVAQLLLSHGADLHWTAPNGFTPFLESIRTGSWANVRMLLKHDPKVLQEHTGMGETALHLAVNQGSYDIVRLLLDRDSDVRVKHPQTNDSLLHLATKERHIILLPLLLERAGDYVFDQNAENRTPLFIAAENGDELAFDYLLNYALKRGFSPQSLLIKDHEQCSLLHAAARGGSITIVQKILAFVPNKKAEISYVNRQRWSPLLDAARSNNGAVVRLLLNYNLEMINERDPEADSGRSPLLWAACLGDEETVAYLLTHSMLDQYKLDRRGCSSLWLAVSQGHTGVARQLLKAPTTDHSSRIAWLNTGDLSDDNSPFLLSAIAGFMEINKLLLAEPDLEIDRRNLRKDSAFLIAIINNYEPLVKLLVEEYKANTSIRNAEGRSALALACEGGHLNIVRYLLARRARLNVDVNGIDNRGHSPLCHTALAERGDSKIVQLLLDSGASIEGTAHLYGRTPLMLASGAENLQIVRILCNQSGIDIDAKDDLGLTALALAAMADNSSIVRLLLDKGADPNSKTAVSGRTPLMNALYEGCENAARELLPKSDLSCVDDAGRTATWYIMDMNKQERKAQFVDSLLQAFRTANEAEFLDTVQDRFDNILGASQIREMFLEFETDKLNINEVDINDHTPLMLLVRNDDAMRVRRLLELGANPKYQSLETGKSAFHIAAAYGSAWALGELLEFINGDHILDTGDLDHVTPLSLAAGKSLKGVKPMSQLLHYRMARMLLEHGADVNNTSLELRQTPLMYAALRGYDKLVGLLLGYGANVNAQDTWYSTPLLMAVQSGDITTVRRLLDAKASYRIKDKSGATPLIQAAICGHLELVRLFYRNYHAGLKDKDRFGRTALSHAAERDHLGIVQYLLQNRPDSDADMLDIRDRQDRTALVWACHEGHFTILRVLMDHGADFRVKDRNKRMPLSHAAEEGFNEIVRLLLEEEKPESRSEMLDWQDSAGRTALSYAAEEGHTEVVRRLLKWGANASLSDSKEQTPRTWALDKGHTKIVNMLDAHEEVLEEESDDAGSDVFHDCAQ